MGREREILFRRIRTGLSVYYLPTTLKGFLITAGLLVTFGGLVLALCGLATLGRVSMEQVTLAGVVCTALGVGSFILIAHRHSKEEPGPF